MGPEGGEGGSTFGDRHQIDLDREVGGDRRVTPIMVLVGRCSLFSGRLVEGTRIAACSMSTSTVKTRRSTTSSQMAPVALS